MLLSLVSLYLRGEYQLETKFFFEKTENVKGK